MQNFSRFATAIFLGLVATVAAAQPPTPAPAAAPTPVSDADEGGALFRSLGGHGGPNAFWVEHAPLQAQATRLAQQFAKSEKDEEKKELRKKLTDILNQLFDAHIQQQEKEMADLEKQLAELKALLKKRQDNKSAIVDRRIDTLVQEANGMGWTAPGSIFGGHGFGSGAASWFTPAAPPAKRNESSGKK
jgi:hypothetical protein